jgi:hypothetical protein
MKKVFEHLRSDGYKYILEILVITIGILGAFVLNNWNEGRKEQLQKIMNLDALQNDFEANQAQLAFIKNKHAEVMKKSKRALDVIVNNQHVTEDSLFTWLVITRGNYTFDAINGSLRSATSSGNVHLIESKELSRLLFQWEDLVKDLNEDELLVREHARSKFDYQNNYVREQDIRLYGQFPTSPSAHNSDIQGLYNDPLFEDYLSRRLWGSKLALTGYDSMESITSRILTLIEQETKN